MEAAIASILEIDESAVPDFGGDSEYLLNIAKFLNAFDLYYVRVTPTDPIIKTMFKIGTV